jgi:hypothetical protein
MVGMKGDRPKGLALLRDVAAHGQAAQREAQSVLASIYASQREQRWGESLMLLNTLEKLYPHNPRYRLKRVYVLQREGLWLDALEAIEVDGSWIEKLDPAVKRRAQPVARYRAAENLLFAGSPQQAGPFLDILEADTLPIPLKEWTTLRRGNYWDALGRRDEANHCYDTVRHKKVKALADTFKKTAFPAGPRDVMPSQWPISNVPSD